MIGRPHAVLLLHGDGWDDVIMVVVGLILAFVVVSVSGRRQPTEDSEAESGAVEAGDGAVGDAEAVAPVSEQHDRAR